MQSNGIVRGFRGYTPAQLEQMRIDLALAMSPQRLSFCAGYYRSLARDPMIDELKMLDTYVAAQARLASSFAPISMATHDDFVAETYADLMQKRHARFPHANTPCTLEDALGMATEYLAYAGKASGLTGLFASLEPKRNAPKGNLYGALTTVDADYGLRLTNQPNVKPSVGDLLVLLLPHASEQPRQGYANCRTLLYEETLTALTVARTTVGEGGLLRTLLSTADGLLIDLNKLSRTGENVPLSMLADGFVGYEIVRIEPSSLETFWKKAKEYGVSAMAFAQVMADTNVTVKRGAFGSFSLESGFLRALAPIRTADVTLADESRYTPAAITHTPLANQRCAYLAEDKTACDAQAFTYGNTVAAVASAAPTDGFFRNAVDTALVSIFTLAVSGCAYNDMRLSVGLTLPRAEDTVQDHAPALSTILGLYRVTAELGIPFAARRIDTDHERHLPRLSVFGFGNGCAAPMQFVGASHFVYRYIPVRLQSGLLDFTALRRDLLEITSLCRAGKIYSARVLAHEALTDALGEMATDGLSCKIEKGASVIEETPSLSILLETDERLPFAYIGKTQVRVHESIVPAPVQRLPEKQYLLPNEERSVLVLASDQDTNADLLCERLIAHGARLARCDVKATDGKTLCKAILEARTVILCDGVTIPADEGVAFSTETFYRAGGWFLLTKGAKGGLSLPVIRLEHGIGGEILDQICKK